ncbi:RNA polymerase sigma-70 factor, ECF subfamily [Formosa sp. Hel1_31_208]|uniref:RNA polymerase sigma factor n=1 Tax=Formosa sp. Hel1_31_208 TaxID=1798225 RepID=UPI00087DD515|nr:RNA polymerase sigma factor [Formosa sp. Hel1_31_208]SDS72661.1 RNA polymerase sigma-70 factor, ECF subfamily [Formosa sp. Hel1_31_208]
MSKAHTILIDRCKQGEEKAMMQIYDLYCQAMFQIACRYLNEEDAKDAMQESFIKAFSKLDGFTESFTFGSWLKRIVINQCIDDLKKKRLEFTASEISNLTIEDDDTSWDFNAEISKQQVLDAIGKLPSKHQVVVKLYLIEGYDHEEISNILNIPIQTSRTHLRRGRLKLQEILKTHYNEARY